MSLRTARRGRAQDITWPGFVDALSSLLMVIIFLLSLFALAQFFLGQALSGRDEALARLRATVADLNESLAAERARAEDLRAQIGALQADIADLQAVRADLTERLEQAQATIAAREQDLTEAADRFAQSQQALAEQTELTQAARDEISQLQANIAGLREQIAQLNAALEAAEAKDEEQQAQIAALGQRLNRALAAKVEELAQFRSEFFGRLKQLLGEREDIRVEGERFIFQSELLFETASADLGPAGRQQLQAVAQALKDIADDLPPDLDWILRVDGHTDKRPIRTPEFPSNWELSAQRAISVVKYLIDQGVPRDRLAATGFSSYQPLVDGDDPADLRRNRRIEFRFTQR
ncbi:MAG: peptidoglycan -binding protein [Rhodothalassiaceae bacterium]